MALFRFGVATEKNIYEEDIEDQIWIRDINGNLVLIGGENYEELKKER